MRLLVPLPVLGVAGNDFIVSPDLAVVCFDAAVADDAAVDGDRLLSRRCWDRGFLDDRFADVVVSFPSFSSSLDRFIMVTMDVDKAWWWRPRV